MTDEELIRKAQRGDYDSLIQVYSSDVHGRALPKTDAEGRDIDGVHEVVMMATKQDHYTLEIYCYEDPVELNWTAMFEVP